jgi:repressor LexA
MPTIQKTKRIYEFIKGSILVNGESPTFREIGEAFNMRSSASVADHVTKMERRGWIRRIPNISRGIRLVEQEQEKAA